ncbi:hypothetical protein [Leisingera sp. ANG-M7]|uniref:hypothetical protein n=1 Tax=Leisingera sp. ANG-M7 TaxID=1577902 RepID=UPI00057F3EBA|nr:hypothetical protein [Leisingera sp. ANG-M7]KIC36385.1 hypothetical protein RA26_13135 [Leisingera sp. ANG-M7]
MIRITLLALALSVTGAAAQTASQDDCEENQTNDDDTCAGALTDAGEAAAAAEAEGVTGFVPLIAPALGAAAAAAGLAAAAGGGSTPSTTSTVSTN